MAKSKQPYIPFYIGDYIKDTRVLPLAVRGAWVDLICFMWDSPVRGELTGTLEEFARMMGCEKGEADFALNLLKQKSTADFDLLEDGRIKITSRKMRRDAEISKIRSEAGKNGVEVKKDKHFAEAKQEAKPKQNTEYENEIDIEVIEENLKSGLNELYLHKIKPTWTNIDFDFEVKSFIEKVRGSPNHYAAHTSEGMRFALQAQLRKAKTKPSGIRKNKGKLQ